MVHTCVVVGCRNRRTPGTTLSFYRFPRDPERKQRWIAAVNRQGWQPNDGSRLCSTHFISGGSVSMETRVLLVKTTCAAECAWRGQVLEAGPRAEPFPERGGAEASGCPDAPARPADGEPRAEGPAPSPCSDSAADCEEEVARLRREVRALRELAERSSLTEAALRADPEKVRFYTGLPSFFVLETVLWLLSPHLRADKGLKLSKFQQLLLALMRLRLDLRNQDLAYRFGVQVAAVARTVRAVVEAMSSTLVPTTVFWPSRDELRRNLPAAVRSACPDCVVVVDCFSVALERHDEADAVDAPARSLKYLIGVAPQGVVTFVSRGAPGHASDRELLERCGLLGKLLPGDVVLADRDLDASEAVAARGAQLRVAGCDGGEEDEEKRALRRHVGRVIGMAKKRYAMLNGPVESPFASDRAADMTTFDRVVRVVCALNNLCISAAPLE
uniref:THAP-type domain-containing protein n=1 Tax=Scleropages formosus TaxID=113540 RepID=A0A8C9T4M6_SCLFO